MTYVFRLFLARRLCRETDAKNRLSWEIEYISRIDVRFGTNRGRNVEPQRTPTSTLRMRISIQSELCQHDAAVVACNRQRASPSRETSLERISNLDSLFSYARQSGNCPPSGDGSYVLKCAPIAVCGSVNSSRSRSIRFNPWRTRPIITQAEGTGGIHGRAR